MMISAVIPVYNSEGTLLELVKRMKQVLDDITSDYELILVNDGSSDGSWKRIEELCREHAWVLGINMMRNYGQHNALLCGIREARGEIIATLDDDLQNPPEEIIRMIKKMEEGYDVVYGTPERERHGLLRDLASRITKLALQSTMGIETARKVSAFRVFRTSIRKAFADYRCPFVSIDVLLTWGTSRFASVVVKHEARKEGKSNYTFMKLVTHALNMMTSFSMMPLQMASVMGIGFAFFGVSVLVFVLARYMLYGGVVEGFAFLASTIAIFSGVQLFAIGIIGEYLARVHFRTMDRPSYAIRDFTGRQQSKENEERV